MKSVDSFWMCMKGYLNALMKSVDSFQMYMHDYLIWTNVNRPMWINIQEK